MPLQAAPCIVVRPTAFGPVAIVWSVRRRHPRIDRVILSRPDRPADASAAQMFPEATMASCADIDAIAGDIEAFVGGEPMRFSLDVVRLHQCAPFQRAVLRAEHAIPRGRVSTYGLIAAHIGRPGAARAVGTALATNPFPLIVPCHRAIRADRHLGGFQGGLAMKRALLEAEGIRFDPTGRVVAARFHYDHT